MDNSIIKFLEEEDEDELENSGPELEAFTAALFADIQATASQGSGSASGQFQSSQQPTRNNENSDTNQQEVDRGVNEQQPVAMGASNLQPLAVGINNQHPTPSGMRHEPVFNSGASNQQAMSMGWTNQQDINLSNRGKKVPIRLLLPVIQPLLDVNKSMQLQTLYKTFESKEITKEAFVQQMRSITGDHLINMAGYKFPQKGTRDDTAQQHMQVPSNVPVESSDFTLDNNALQQYEVGREGDSHDMQATQMNSSYLSDSRQDREHPTFPVQGFNKQQQQPQASFPTYWSTGNNQHPSLTSNVTTSAASLRQAYDSQMRQHPVHHNDAALWHKGNSKEQRNPVPLSVTYLQSEAGGQSNEHHQRYHLSTSQAIPSGPAVLTERRNANHGNPKNDTLEMQPSKLGFSASRSQMNYKLPVSCAPSPIAAANSARTPIKKPPARQKKPLEALGSSTPPSSKKQKVSGGVFFDQSVEQFNDFIAVSGVNLREEEGQLFSLPKEDSRVSEASRRVMQAEEDRLILQKSPLQKKLAQIMAKSGLKSLGSDVEKCLSLCVEERLRGQIFSLIRLSKQRVDIEKPRHRTFITTDVRKKIMAINQKVRVESEKKQTEEEKLQRLNEANKEADEKMRTTAANDAVRAAVGGDDMLSKWQLMVEQARQAREGGTDGSSGSQADNNVSWKTSRDEKGDHHETEKRGQSSSTPGSIRKFGRSQVIMAHNRVARAISVKDVIAGLEREPQMSRSTLMYRLCNEICSESFGDSSSKFVASSLR